MNKKDHEQNKGDGGAAVVIRPMVGRNSSNEQNPAMAKIPWWFIAGSLAKPICQSPAAAPA